MNRIKIMKLTGLTMLVIAIGFLVFAFTHPEAGSVFYIGNLAIGSNIWRAFYLFYTVVMIGLFVISVYLDKKTNAKHN